MAGFATGRPLTSKVWPTGPSPIHATQKYTQAARLTVFRGRYQAGAIEKFSSHSRFSRAVQGTVPC